MMQLFHSQGWHRRGIAALLGALSTAALPPIFLLPLLIPAFSGLFLLTLNARNHKQAFFDGWWWGLGHFASGLYWVCISLYVEPEKFAWLTPFALFGLPSVLGVYTGLVTLSLYAVTRYKGRDAKTEENNNSPQLSPRTSHVFLFAALWITGEYLRAHLFTGFPWNLIGYALNGSDYTLQAASLWGIYGQGYATIILATLPALLLTRQLKPVRVLLSWNLLFVALVGFGVWRLATHPTEYTHTQLRIVQANIAQSLKFDPATILQGLKKHLTLTHSEGLKAVDLVIWPETAVPYLMNPTLAGDLGNILPDNTLLFTGGMRSEGDEKARASWNSAFVLNHAGEMVAHYDKHHLVPFGEYVPLRGILPVEAIAGGMGDFARGPGPATLAPGNIPPFSPLICYEAIFPDKTTDGHGTARWIVTITNDAWFGNSTGPYQHLEMTRARAVEQGLPLARAANTGISAITDPYGRILKSLALGTEGIIDTPLPAPSQAKTIMSRLSDGFVIVLLYIVTYLVGIRRQKR